jgi:hypothetical protein
MATVADIRTKVLNILQKTPGYQGAYSDARVLDAIQEAFDYVAMWMFDSCGGCWQSTVGYLSPASGVTDIAFPTDIVMMKELRYLVGNKYIPMVYDEAIELQQYKDTITTTVDQDSNVGTTTLFVASTNGLNIGDVLQVGTGTARYEQVTVSSVSSGVSVTTGALAFTHTALQADQVQLAGSGVTQYPTRWRIVDENIHFNPALGQGGSNYLQYEGWKFPTEFADFTSAVPAQFHRALIHYIKYRAASVLVASRGKAMKEWQEYEMEWKEQMLIAVNKRVNSIGFIREFEA